MYEKKSTHQAEVIPMVREKHPNADLLSVVPVYGYSCVIKTADWEGVEKAAFIPPDTVVDTNRPEFAFLATDANAEGKVRIKAKKLRGIVSYGMLVPAPANAQVGDDLWEQLGLERYEPPEPSQGQKDKFVIGGEEEPEPEFLTGPSKYDIDSFERFHKQFSDGEIVHVLEKVDGSNFRAFWANDRLYVKTRNRWVRRTPNYDHVTLDGLIAKGVPEEKAAEIVTKVKSNVMMNSFWEVIERTSGLVEFLKANPGTVVFGEIFGTTNRIKYGFKDGNRAAIFDVYRDGKFLNMVEARELTKGLQWVPSLTPPEGAPYSFELVKRLATGKTTVEGAKSGTIREGAVVRPAEERYEHRVGRVIFKSVNPEFLEKA